MASRKKVATCKGVRKDGKPCKGKGYEDGYCKHHIHQKPKKEIKKSRAKSIKAYREYLKSPEWAVKRQIVLSVLGETCKLCGKSATTVHHNTYKTLFEENILKDLTVLCSSCHAKYHKKGNYRGNKTRRR